MPYSICVSPEGRGLPTQLSLFDEKQVAGHKRLVDAIHSKGSLVAAQLYHAGRQASEAITGLDPLAPSAIPCGILQNHPKEITHEQMDRIKEQFRQAARWSIEAGYDIVEVHFAHGYLLHSFMSTHTNHRTDEYGGSFENRIKYPMDVLKTVIDEVNGEVPVQIRINVVENDEADIVAIGRGLIADPLLVDKIKAHDYGNIRYCIACNQGCIDRVLGGMPAHCMVNPVAGEELTCKLKGKSDKKVVIIGAGPAGMEAAITAAQRGMKVTVYEKGELGGKFKALSTPPEKDTFTMFDRYLVSQMKKYNIEVINKKVKADDEFDADTIILATGSKQIVPPIQGIEQEFVLQAEDVLEN